ncbi:hypothetical protein LQZ18_03085 [Lachnospiraceae bacterium ZAX-1]
MKLFLQEIRKILRPLPVLILVAFTILFVFSFIKAPYDYLNGYPMSSDYVKLSAQLKEIVGEPVTPEKIDDGIAVLRQRVEMQALENIRQHMDILMPLGVTDYASYYALESKIFYSHSSEDQINEIVSYGASYSGYAPYDPKADYTLTQAEADYAGRHGSFEFIGSASCQLEFIDNTLANANNNYGAFMKMFDERNFFEGVYEGGRSRIGEILRDNEMMNILPPYEFSSHAGEAFTYLAILILLTICILFAPIVTRDNMAGVRALQYSSKAGRKTLRIQLCAMLTSAFMIALAEIAVTFAVFLRGTWASYIHSGLHSLFSPYSYSWFAGTLGQWLICCAILILAVSLAATFFVFILSKVSKNYISLLLGLVPVTAAFVFICVLLFAQPFSITSESNNLYRYLPIPFAEAFVGGVLLAVGAISAGIMLNKAKY